MEREYKTIKTPIGGHEVILKSWLTGREKREINSVYTKDITFLKGTEYQIPASKLQEAQDVAIKAVVISVNGDKGDNLLDVILEMHSQDYDFVLKAVDEVTSPVKEEEKKK